MTYNKGYLFLSIAILLLSFTTIQSTSDRSSVILPPTLSSPIDGATNVPLSPTFEFSEQLNNATIEIYEGNDFTLPDNLDLDGYVAVDSVQVTNTRDLSGVTYGPDNLLYMITNNASGGRPAREIIITDLEGNFDKAIRLSGWEDTEDIVYLDGNNFAIIEEDRGRVYFANILSNTPSISRSGLRSEGLTRGNGPWTPFAPANNPRDIDGIEGVSYDTDQDRIYVVDEKRRELHSFRRSDTNPTNTLIDCDVASDLNDLSGIYHPNQQNFDNLDVNDHFLLLSHASNTLIETDADCATPYSQLNNLPTVLPSGEDPKFEGVTMDNNGTIYLVSEPNWLYIYKNNNCNLSKVPTGRLAHEDNNVNGASYNLPIKLKNNTEYTWRIRTEEGCSEFSSFMTAPCTVNVTKTTTHCNDNCTPNDLTDDKFTITVSATVEGDFYTVNDGEKTSPLIPSGDSIKLGPYFTDITADIELTFADTANPDCTATIMVLRLPCSTSLEETVSSSISSGNDDAYEANDGTMNLTSTTIQLGQNNTAGLIFRNPGIPQGATILYAIAQFSAGAISTEIPSNEATTLMISADKNSSARVFSTFNNDITNRPMVSKRVQWEVDPWNVGQRDAAQQTPDISILLQEIVDRASFSENSNIGIIISGTGNRVIQTHESGMEQAATLTVKYTTKTCPPKGTDCDDADPSTDDDMHDGECCCMGCPPAGEPCSDGNPRTRVDMQDGKCNCIGIPTDSIGIRIKASEDDVEENGKTGSISASNDKIKMVRSPGKGNQSIGLRFININIPRDSEISLAELEFTAENRNNKNGTLTIYAEAVNNSAPFDKSDRRNVSSRTKTSNSIVWNTDIWEGGAKYRTNNIAPLIQELIGRDDWVGDSVAITIIIEGTGRRVAKSFDGSPNDAPLLRIKYTDMSDTALKRMGIHRKKR